MRFSIEDFLQKNMKQAFAIALGALYLMTFSHASIQKIGLSSAPDWFNKSFSQTFLAGLPGGLDLSFLLITYSELLLALLFLGSIVVLFFNLKRGLLLLELSLLGSVVMFTSLSFGQRLVGSFSSSGQLFFYASFSFVAFVLLRVLMYLPEKRSV